MDNYHENVYQTQHEIDYWEVDFDFPITQEVWSNLNFESYFKSLTAQFEVYSDQQGQYRYRLRNNHAVVILRSEAYSDQKSCVSAINTLKRSINYNDTYFPLVNPQDKYYYLLISSTMRVMGVSPKYHTINDRANGLSEVRKCIIDAEIKCLE